MNRLVLIGGAGQTADIALEIRRMAKSEGVSIADGDILSVGVDCNGKKRLVSHEEIAAILLVDKESLALFMSDILGMADVCVHTPCEGSHWDTLSMV